MRTRCPYRKTRSPVTIVSGIGTTNNGAPVEIRPFMGADVSDADLRRCHELFVAKTRRTFPGLPQQPYASFAANWRLPRQSGGSGPRHAWAAYEADRLIGFGTIVYPSHMPDWAMPSVYVDEADWRRGIGTALLREIVADAHAEGRTTLGNEQVRIGSEAEHWARAVGFACAQARRWQMLHIADVDRARWDVPVPAGFRLVQWADAAPDELVAAFAVARNAIADAPNGDSDHREPEWTVERVRRAEADIRAIGDDARYVVAVHEESGAVAGITGLLLEPGRLDLCWQRDTAVVDRFRGLGLGLVIKSAMMRWVTAEFPGLEKVITNTAAENAHMIRVNERIGYVRYADIGRFEASVERMREKFAALDAIPVQRGESAPAPSV